MNKKSLLGLIAAIFLLFSCDNPLSTKAIKIGVITGSEFELLEFVEKKAQKEGLNIKLVAFNDYIMPNEALRNGDIDLNAFQHEPYLNQQIKDRNYDFTIIGKTFVYPIAAYSKKIKSIDELKDGATIAIPNDPTNLGRALLLLQSQGFITVDPEKKLLPTVLDITSNPRNFKIIELEAPQLPRILDDSNIDLAIINTTYASQIGFTPEKNGIFVEGKNSPYVNLIVAKTANKNDPRFKQFIQIYQTDEVAKKAQEIFNGGAIKGW